MSSLSYKTNFLPLELQSAGLYKIRSVAVVAAFLAAAPRRLLGFCRQMRSYTTRTRCSAKGSDTNGISL